jgi:5-methylcytosine-specific restriction enzyme A
VRKDSLDGNLQHLPEGYLRRGRRTNGNDNRRARKATRLMPWNTDTGRTVPPALRRACFRRDNWCCVKCGYHGRPHTGELHCDHIMPVAEGGTDILANLSTLCVPCHKQKTQAEAARGRQRRSGKRRPPLHPADALAARGLL